MDFLFDVIKNRRSTRSFIKNKLPPIEQINKIVEAATWAPSGMGKQLWHFTVVYNAEKSLHLAKLIAKAGNRGEDYNFYNAPVNIIISYKRDEKHAFLDGSAAMQNILLMAESFKLGSCWINQIRDFCDEPFVRSCLTQYGVPQDNIVIGSAAIGYIEKPTPAKERAKNTINIVY